MGLQKIKVRGETFYLLPEKEVTSLRSNIRSFMSELVMADEQPSGTLQFYKGKNAKCYHVATSPTTISCGAGSSTGFIAQGFKVTVDRSNYDYDYYRLENRRRVCSNCYDKYRSYISYDGNTVRLDENAK